MLKANNSCSQPSPWPQGHSPLWGSMGTLHAARRPWTRCTWVGCVLYLNIIYKELSALESHPYKADKIPNCLIVS